MKLNAKILTLTLFGLLFSNLYSQENNDPVVNYEEDDRSFRLGLVFAPNISWLNLNTSGYSSDGARIGFTYGISTEFFLAKNYLLSTGFSINNIGGKVRYESIYDNAGVISASEVKQIININYVDIPITLKLRTNEIGYLTYYGNFGFNMGIKYSSKSDFEYLDFNSIKRTEVNTNSSISLININLVVGGGLEYNISGNTNLAIGVTFHNGFTNVLRDKTHELNTIGKALIDSDGKAVYTDKKANATLNYFSLDLAIYF